MPKNSRADESILHRATKDGSSLRATIPSFIANQLDLKRGDKVRWKIDGERIIIEPQKGKTNDNEIGK